MTSGGLWLCNVYRNESGHLHLIFIKLLIVPSLTAFLGVLLGGCRFEPDIPPLILPTAPSQPFQGFDPDESEPPLASAQSPTPAQEKKDPISARAIELCGGRDFDGDEQVGSCLAPGGETYYVWIDPATAIEVNRNDAHLASFRFAAIQRKNALVKMEDKGIRLLKGIGLLPFEILGLAVCGPAVAPGPHQLIAVPTCLGDLVAIGFTSEGIARNAEDTVKSIISFYGHSIDAGYNFCRMEGFSDAECRKNGAP